MPSLNDVKLDAIYCMLKGEPGTYKSTEALSFPLPQYWFSRDRKMSALMRPAKEWGIDMSQVQYDDYDRWNTMKAKIEAFQSKCPYKTLIFDSVTSIGDMINLGTIREEKGNTGKGGDERGTRIGGIDVNTFTHYKAENQAFMELIDLTSEMRTNMNINIVLIAHVVGERKESERGITSHSRIIITGAKTISGKIPAYCDEVYHFSIKPNVNADKPGNLEIYTQSTADDFARTSLDLPLRFDCPLDKPLYPTFIKPALEKLNNLKPIRTL